VTNSIFEFMIDFFIFPSAIIFFFFVKLRPQESNRVLHHSPTVPGFVTS